MVRATQRRQMFLEQLEDRCNPSHFTAAIVGAPAESPEGSAVALSSTVTPVTTGEVINVASYSWSVTKDGTAFAMGTEATFSFTPDDNGVYVVSLTVTDTASDTATAPATTTTALNVAPTATVAGPAVVVPGMTATFTLNAADPSTLDQAAGFTFNVDWNADGTVDETVTGPSGTQVTHVFTETGDVQVTVTATDKDGGVSAPTTLDVGVDTVALVDDPANPGKTALFVAGTEGDDKIHFNPGKGGSVRVRVNGVDEGSFSPTSAIVVLAGEGNDNIQMAGSIRIAARLHGEGGNDRIKAAKGGSVLDGGDGDDKLIGGNARDVLIGGAGADDLNGGPGDDILIAGSLSAETDDTAMALLLAEWNGTGDYATRVEALAATLVATDDGVADKLTGASGMDWFLTTDPLDKISGLGKTEVVNAPTDTDDGTDDDGTGDDGTDDGKDKGGGKDKGDKGKGKDKGGKGKKK